MANNAVDLPLYWNIGDAAVTPMYELREVGVASVGRIAENNGFLIIADITEIIDIQLEGWMRGYSDFPVTATQALAVSYIVLIADSTTQLNMTTGALNRNVDVDSGLANLNPDFYIWVKKVDAGAGKVTFTFPISGGLPAVELAAINDTVLIHWDKVLAIWVTTYFSGGTIPASAPYGVIPAIPAIVQRVPWAVANGEYGQPTKWAPAFQVWMPAASANIVLPFPSTVFVRGTKVAVISGGPLGGTLGGQEDTPVGVAVTGVAGRTVTLAISTDVGISYPRVVTIMRWSDISSLVGRDNLQGDNSEITSLASLREWLVVCRTTGFYLGRYTGDPNAPFVFTPAYAGSNVPFWPDAIANVQGDYLLYPARGGRMYKFDGTSWPQLHETTDNSALLFFTGYTQDSEVFAVDNSITKESFFCYPDKTLAFDYNTPGGTLSLVDKAFDAAAMIHKPGTTDFWFVLAIGRFIKTYGLAYGLTPIQTFLRDGVAVSATLVWGLWSAGDKGHEKMLRELTPIFASQSPDAAVDVYIGTTYNPNVAVTQKLVPPESLPTPSGRNYVTLCLQAIFFETKIVVTDTRDVDCRLTELILEADLIGGFGGVTRSIN